MLRNVKYQGTYLYNREDGKKKSQRVLLEKYDEVRNEGAIPAIVTKSTFDKVQSILDCRTQCRPNLNTHSEYILTGKLYCAKCGSTMSGTANCGGRNKTRIRTYACPNHSSRRGNVCDTKAINSLYLESAVKSAITEAINAYVRDKDNLASIVRQAKSSYREQINSTSRRIASLRDNVSHLLNKAASTTSALLSTRYEQEANEAILAEQHHTEKLADLNAKVAEIDVLIDASKEALIFTADALFASDSITRELVDLYINRIEIDDANDKITVKFKNM
ncbi:MAG: recombinase zinc beta ribbon domain-containing protein [Clostridia bacterium]|nr:recombinase zinc beta ribbon domain-containing protein [Clostridia bacterium]